MKKTEVVKIIIITIGVFVAFQNFSLEDVFFVFAFSVACLFLYSFLLVLGSILDKAIPDSALPIAWILLVLLKVVEWRLID